MAGQLLLAGIHPEDTPITDWCAAVFAVLVNSASAVDEDKLEQLLDKLGEPFPGEERDDLDPDTWGTSEKAQEAQQRLFATFGLSPQGDAE